MHLVASGAEGVRGFWRLRAAAYEVIGALFTSILYFLVYNAPAYNLQPQLQTVENIKDFKNPRVIAWNCLPCIIMK